MNALEKAAKKAAKFRIKSFEDMQREENEKVERAVVICLEACDGRARLDKVIGTLLDRVRCPAFYLDRAASCFWAKQMKKLVVGLNKIYDELKRRKITEKKYISFNDSDDSMFYIPNKQRRVIVHTGQSFNYLYIWENAPGWGRLHIRQFYDRWSIDDDPEWRTEEVNEFKKEVQKNGYKAAIMGAEGFGEWADDYKGNNYPDRLSLESFKKSGFKVEYGDGRDLGYIASWDEFADSVETPLRRHTELRLVVGCFIPCMLQELFDGRENKWVKEQGFDQYG